jgi:hypothetical protein
VQSLSRWHCLDGQEVLEGEVYDFEELERIDRGFVSVAVEPEIVVIGEPEVGSWDVGQLMSGCPLL